MDEDEDVVFENSALHEHLREAGFSEEYVKVERKSQVSTIKQMKTDPTYTTSNTKNKWFYSHLKQNFMDFVFDDGWCREIRALGRKHAAKITEECVRCGDALVEEDLAFVESYSSSVNWEAYEDESEDSPLRSDDSIMGQMLTQVGILGVTIAYGFFRMFYVKSAEISAYLFIYALDVLSVLLTTVALAPATLKFALAGRLVSRLDARSVAVAKFLSEIQHEQRLFSKAVLFVRESELMKRGFTLMKLSSMQLESSSGERQCPDLRRVLFSRARKIFLRFRSATETLLSQNSSLLNCELSNSEYLACMPVERFGPCVILNESEREQLEKETDYYCLTAIQGIIELMDVQISEFIRVLCILCLSQAECLHSLPVRDFHSYCDVLSSVTDELATDCKALEKVLIFNKTLAIKLDKLSARDSERHPLMKQLPSKTMYIAVHSLMLHLHAAVSRLQSTDAELEKLADQGGDEAPSRELLENLEAVLQHVRREIIASKDCCDEAESRVGRLIKPHDGQVSAENKEKSADDVALNEIIKTSRPLIMIPQCNPVVEDEVFEGFTNEKSADIDDSSYLFSDEKKSRRDKAEVMRLLTELQSVIAARAVDTKEREARALARQAGQQVNGEQSTGGASQQVSDKESTADDSNISADHDQCTSGNDYKTTSIKLTSMQNNCGDSVGSGELINNYDITKKYIPQSISNETSSVSKNKIEDQTVNVLASQNVIDRLGQSWHINKYANKATTDTTKMDMRNKDVSDFTTDSADDIYIKSSDSKLSATSGTNDLENNFVGLVGGTFTSAVAQLAVKRSREMPAMCVETFGDDSDEESDNSEIERD